MNPVGARVKARRTYDSSGRRARAMRTQTHVLAVAAEHFLRDGYAATTVAAVAGAAGVSAETIYKTFGGKPGLIRALQRSGLDGTGPVPAPTRSDELSSSDPHVLLRHWANLTTEVSPRVAPLNLLVRAAAATDPVMAAFLDDINKQRLERMHHNAHRLADPGHLRRGLTTERARDVMFTYTAPELFEILVTRQGWTLDQYGDFVFRGLVAELLDG